MPPNQCSRLNNNESVTPIEALGELSHSEASSGIGGFSRGIALLVQGELFSEKQIFSSYRIVWLKQQPHIGVSVTQ